MPGRVEPRVIRTRPLRTIRIAQGATLARGQKDLAPKHFDTARALLALLWGGRVRAGSLSRCAAYLAADDGADARRVVPWLSTFERVTISPVRVGGILDEVALTAGPTSLAIVGASIPASASHAALAESLSAHGARRDAALLSALSAYARDSMGRYQDHALFGAPPVIEERPGRASPLRIEAPTLKQQLKRWQAGSSREPTEGGYHQAPMSGFGLGSVAVAPDGEHEAASWRSAKVASCDVAISAESGFDLGVEIAKCATSWLSEINAVKLSQLRTVIISDSSLSISSLVFEGLVNAGASSSRPRYPDLVYGWQPSLSLVEALLAGETPVLFVGGGDWPVFHFVLVTA